MSLYVQCCVFAIQKQEMHFVMTLDWHMVAFLAFGFGACCVDDCMLLWPLHFGHAVFSDAWQPEPIQYNRSIFVCSEIRALILIFSWVSGFKMHSGAHARVSS